MTFGVGKGNLIQYSYLGNLMDRRASRATVHGVLKELDNLATKQQHYTNTHTHTHTHIYIVKKEMAIHSSILYWKIPSTEEPGRLPSIRSQRV